MINAASAFLNSQAFHSILYHFPPDIVANIIIPFYILFFNRKSMFKNKTAAGRNAVVLETVAFCQRRLYNILVHQFRKECGASRIAGVRSHLDYPGNTRLLANIFIFRHSSRRIFLNRKAPLGCKKHIQMSWLWAASTPGLKTPQPPWPLLSYRV